MDIMPLTTPAAALMLLARHVSGYQDLLGGTIPSITFLGGGLSSMAPFRGKLAIAQTGTRLQLLDLAAATPVCTSLTEAPKGGLTCEYKGMLWCGGDEADDDSSDSVTVPLVGVVLPPPAVTVLVAGSSADVVYNGVAGTSTVKDTSGVAEKFTGMTGKIIVVAGSGYPITAVSTTTVTNDTVTVKAVGGQPNTATGVAYSVLNSSPLKVYPDTLDLGTTVLFNDSGGGDARIFNCGTTSIRLTAVLPKGPEIRVTEVPSLPLTLPPGGSCSFRVIGTPESKGACAASIVIEHDFYAQDSLVIPVTVKGTSREVVAVPSVLHFGAWIAGGNSPYLELQFKNPLDDAVVFKAAGVGGWVMTGTCFSLDPSTPLPTTDTTVEPGKSISLKVRFSPASNSTGAPTGSITFKRVVPAKPYRLWRSRPGDPTAWDRDREWTDLSSDGLAGGKIRSIRPYDDGLVVHKDASIWAVVPSGMGSGFRGIQLALGEGVGAFGPQAVALGGGRLWWASKAGVYCLLGQDILPISSPIEDIFRALPANQFSAVRLAFYDGMLWLSIPYGATTMLWAYSPEGGAQGKGTWWRADYQLTAMAADRGATRKEAFYGIQGTTLLHLDDAEGSGTAWSMTTPLITGSDPTVLKVLDSIKLHASETGLISSVRADFTNGARAYAVCTALETGALLAGVGLFNPLGYIDVDDHGYADGDLNGKAINVAGFDTTIVSHVGNRLTLTANPTGIVAARWVTFSVASTGAVTPLVGLLGQFGEEAAGSLFSVLVSGSTVLISSNPDVAGKGELGGFSVDFAPLCKERAHE